MPFLYFLSTDETDLELAQAELWAMTGCEAQGRIGVSPVACDIARSAYVAVCGEVIAHASTFAELCAVVESQNTQADGFRIDVRKLAPKPDADSMDVTRGLADALPGFPNLDNPRERYFALCQEGSWWFTRVLSRIDRGYQVQNDRPHNLSQALGARHARALVNLAAAPGDALLDPCCGAGTSLIEARLMGVRAYGSDLCKSNAFITAANLAHFAMPRTVAIQDARTVSGQFDGVVIDFPYGHSTFVEEGLYHEVLSNLADKAFRLAVILGRPGEDLFASLSLKVLRRARVRSSHLVRHFYLLRGRRRAQD